MSDDKFDAIIVGAGLAGCTAGYLLAKEGLSVLLIERGNYAGSKNMTGGRLYAHSLEKIMASRMGVRLIFRRFVSSCSRMGAPGASSLLMIAFLR